MKARSALVCGLLLILPLSSSAWGDGGHMIVAQIAYGRLNKNAKAQVDRLVKVLIEPTQITARSLNFLDAAHWPDDVRRQPGFEFSADLHFIDIPFTTDGTPLPSDLPKPNNIVKALAKYVEVLRTSKNPDEQAQALRFVIHFVGDIHQPLHCASRVTTSPRRPEGDLGGNEFMIQVRDQDGYLHPTKLHGYWDSGIGSFPRMGRDFVPPPMAEIPAAARSISAQFPDNDPALKIGEPFNYEGWAKEGERLAETVAYKGIVEGQEPTPQYNEAALKVARHQVALAGYRLAALLNAIWPDRQ
jgi:hypothetical protein